MRKLLVAVVLLCSVFGVAFARGNMEILGGFPFQTIAGEGYLNGTIPATLDLTYSGLSVGVGFYEFGRTSRVTFGGFMNVQFPSENKIVLKSDIGEASSSSKVKDNFDSYLIFDMLLGPVFKVLSTKKVELLLTPGVHARYDRFESGNSAGGNTFLGIGANAGINFYFTQSFYATGKFTFAYDFFLFGSDEGIVKTGMSMIPTLGLGVRL